MKTKIGLGVCLVMLFAVAPASAQFRGAGSKINGNAYREWTSYSYGRAAYPHAEALGEYSRNYSYIPAETATEHATEVHRNLTNAKKELSKVKTDDKTVTKHVDTLHEHYDKAIKSIKELETESAKNDKADAKKLATLSDSVTNELKAADAIHKQLVEHMKATDKK